MELGMFAIGALIVLAPIGIWNRLIKIHGDLREVKEVEEKKLEYLERIAEALEKHE